MADRGDRRYRKGDDIGARLEILSSNDTAARVALLVRESSFGISAADLVARTGLREVELGPAPMPGWYVDPSWFKNTSERLVKAVREFHRAQPLLPGIARQDLRSREVPACPPAVFDALVGAAKELAAEGETVRLRTHEVVLKADEEQARAAIETAFEKAGLAVPPLTEVLARSGVEAARARRLLQILLREKRLLRVSDELIFHRSAVEGLKALLTSHRSARFNVGTFKEWTGISRKYAIPLLEFLDREHVTRREGDERVVL